MRDCYFDQTTRAIADLVRIDGDRWLVTRINVPAAHRGRGLARELLRRIVGDADATGSTLVLEVSPSDGLGRRELESWYARHGFESNGAYMVREPQVRAGSAS